MIQIVRYDHISMAVAELEPQIELLQGLFGFRYEGRFEEEGFFGANLDIPGTSGLGWEVIAPNGPDSYLHRFLSGANGPGLHHVTIRVPDIVAASSALRAEGIEPWGTRAEDEEEEQPSSELAEAEPPADEASATGEVAGEPEPAVADTTGPFGSSAGAPPPAEPATDEPATSPAAGGEVAATTEAPDDDPRGVTYIHPRQGGHGFLFQLYAGEPWHVPAPFEDEGEHTLGIKAVNHLAHAHADRDELADWYRRLFGMTLAYRSPDEGDADSGFRTVVLDTATHQLRFEVISPAGGESFIQRFLERRGPSMHHVTFEVGDWERALHACAHHGVAIFGERSGATGGVLWREAFIHPRDTGGVLVQFFWEAQPGAWV